MKITIRLYRRHDMDLLVLYKNKNFGFQKALKKALKAYIHKEPYLVYQPETQDFSKADFKYSYQTFLILDDVYDKEIIDWLKNVKKNHRNILLKTILRGSIVGPLAYGCMEGDDDRMEHNLLLQRIKTNVPNLLASPKRRQVSATNKKKNSSTVSDIKKPLTGTTTEQIIKPIAKELKNNNESNTIKEVTVSATTEDLSNISENNEDDFDLFSSAGDIMSQF